jgi:hypothetical protein
LKNAGAKVRSSIGIQQGEEKKLEDVIKVMIGAWFGKRTTTNISVILSLSKAMKRFLYLMRCKTPRGALKLQKGRVRLLNYR